jgi:tetratricopeptide (TPR) repeat protein
MSYRSAAGLAAALALLAAGVVTAVPIDRAEAGDVKVADTLFKSGKQALAKGDCPGAVTYFDKALAENADLIEAIWWRASAQEKAGDRPAALGSYREYLARFEEKSGTGAATSKEEARLKALAEKSADTLAVAEKEFKKLEDGFVASLLTIAKDNFVRDPALSLRAVQTVLSLRPDDEEALKLNEKLGGSAPAPIPKAVSTPAAFNAVKEWTDFIALRTLSASDTISYGGETMTVDTKGGTKVTDKAVDLGTAFALDTDFRVLETYERGWLTGLVFAGSEGHFYSAFVLAGRVALLHAQSQEVREEVAKYDMNVLDTAAWHRLGVMVKGADVEVWLDRKKVISWHDASAAGFAGEVGIYQQRCKTERRVLRAGKL